MLKEAILNSYKSALIKRFDDKITFYFSPKDFPNLKVKPYQFHSFKGDLLKGNFYFYDGYKENHIVVFDHGMGAGHTAYFREIELLCKNGYLVFSYDHTGCMSSGGAHSNGFLTSIADLDSCLTNLKENYPNHKISVIGHSWGGFSTSNIAKYHPDVAHVISLAPFNSLSSILHQTFHGLLSFGYKLAYDLEVSYNEEYASSSAIEALRNYTGNALIIHSKDDNVLNIKYHFNKIKKELGARDNIKFVMVDKKLHNPNYTVEAVKLLQKYLKEKKKRIKENKLNTLEEITEFNSLFDWWKITEQDDSVWKLIFNTLEK